MLVLLNYFNIKNMTIKEKIMKNAIPDETWLENAKKRQENRDWQAKSSAIALKVLRHIRKENITQKKLAEQLGCSPQNLSKILKGSKNLTLETICKLEKVTGLVLVEVPSF